MMYDVPEEVIDAAKLVELWFDRKGVKDWELCGIRKRNVSSIPVDWFLAERVTNDSITRSYLYRFSDDPNHENAVNLVRHIMRIERNKTYGVMI